MKEKVKKLGLVTLIAVIALFLVDSANFMGTWQRRWTSIVSTGMHMVSIFSVSLVFKMQVHSISFFFNYVMMLLFSECLDKPLQKFDMRSYQEVVLSQLKQMSDDNQLLILYKNKAEKFKKELEVLRGSFNTVCEKMRKVSQENLIVRQRTKLHHIEIKEEVISDPV